MPQYHGLDGSSGIAEYELLPDAIVVTFKKGGVYLYTYASAGMAAVEEMKRLAAEGQGLTTYINQHHPPYQTKQG